MFADKAVFDFIYELSHKALWLDWLFIFFANAVGYFVVAAALFYLVFKVSGAKKQISVFLSTLLAIIISRGILTEVIRFFTERSRPFVEGSFAPLFPHDTTFSFPSGHMVFLVPLVLSAFSLNRKLGFWLAILTLGMGFARIASGVHYPSDILGGIVVGAIGFYLAKFILRKPSQL